MDDCQLEIRNGPHLYQVGPMVAQTEECNYYTCEADGERECLLQIATDVSQNGTVSRNAHVLQEFLRRSDELEAEYAKVRENPKSTLRYNFGFPELVDSFVSEEQGHRRVNILAFRNVAKVGQMVPLSNLRDRDGLRVDLRTSAWIMGKALKMLVFAHICNGVAVNDVSGDNILIDPDQHYVVIFDWGGSKLFPEEKVSGDIARAEITQLARTIIKALGANPETGAIPDDGKEKCEEYKAYLTQLACGKERSAKRAHEEFYRIVDSLWKGFYPFTTLPL